MSTSLRVFDRVLTGLLAVLILTGAAWVIGYGADVAVARDTAAPSTPTRSDARPSGTCGRRRSVPVARSCC